MRTALWGHHGGCDRDGALRPAFRASPAPLRPHISLVSNLFQSSAYYAFFALCAASLVAEHKNTLAELKNAHEDKKKLAKELALMEKSQYSLKTELATKEAQ